MNYKNCLLKPTVLLFLSLASMATNAEFSFSITSDDGEIDFSSAAENMSLLAIESGSQPCAITITLSDTQLPLAERYKQKSITFNFVAKDGLQTGSYSINPEAQPSTKWATENQNQVYANWARSKESGKTAFQGHNGSLKIKRNGDQVSGSYKGQFMQYKISPFGKAVDGKAVDVVAEFSHTLAINSKSYGDTYRCKQ